MTFRGRGAHFQAITGKRGFACRRPDRVKLRMFFAGFRSASPRKNMPFPIQEFWNLATESRLFTPQECQRLAGAFGQIRGATESGNAFTLSEWLISQRVMTRYQAKVLLARRPGPFLYGDYKVQER